MTLTPLLSVRRGAEAVTFYETAFGAGVTFRLDDGDSAFAQLAIQDQQFWLSDESPEHGNYSPETLGGSSMRLIPTVDDPDAVFDLAIAAGAQVVSPVSEQNGWLTARLADPFGHHWEIGKPV